MNHDDVVAAITVLREVIVVRDDDMPLAMTGNGCLVVMLQPADSMHKIVIRNDDLLNTGKPIRIALADLYSAHDAEAQEMVELVNLARQLEGASNCAPLRWRDDLAAVADAHSADMIRRHFMAHVNPDGKNPAARLADARIRYSAYGENIAGGPTGLPMPNPERGIMTGYPSVQQAHIGLMNSPGHRENILSPLFTNIGIGIMSNLDGTLVITQVFVHP
jgi:uncharacterized protein YkwD